MKRPLIILVQMGLAAAAGYVAWRVAAHRLHLFGAPSVWIGLFVFAAALFFLAAFRRGGVGSALFALLPIGAAAAAILLLIAMVRVAKTYGSLAIDNPALTAAWIIVATGAVGAARRLAAKW